MGMLVSFALIKVLLAQDNTTLNQPSQTLHSGIEQIKDMLSGLECLSQIPTTMLLNPEEAIQGNLPQMPNVNLPNNEAGKCYAITTLDCPHDTNNTATTPDNTGFVFPERGN